MMTINRQFSVATASKAPPFCLLLCLLVASLSCQADSLPPLQSISQVRYGHRRRPGLRQRPPSLQRLTGHRRSFQN